MQEKEQEIQEKEQEMQEMSNATIKSKKTSFKFLS